MNEANILAQDLVAEQPKFFFRAGDLKKQMMETFAKGKVPGEPTGLTQLDKNLTIRKGFLYSFTGYPSNGKTEFITQLLVLQVANKKRKIALYSPESYPIEEFIDSIIHCYLGKTTDKRFGAACCSAEEYMAALEWVHENFFFLDWEETPSPEEVLSGFAYLENTFKVEIFVIDPFNSLVSEGESLNIAASLKKTLTKFKRFAAKNKVIVFLVEHPKTPSEKEDTKKVPGPRQMFGGTMWWNKVDVFVSVHRIDPDNQNNNEVMIKIWKVKNQHLNGKPGEVVLNYYFTKRRYFDESEMDTNPFKAPLLEAIKKSVNKSEDDSIPF